MTKYIIQDWAGNICFQGKTFDTFDDAWGFLYETFPEEELIHQTATREFDSDLQEYEVVELEKESV